MTRRAEGTGRPGRRGRLLLLVLACLAAGATSGCAGRSRAADVKVIAHGEEVDLADHLAPGKHTVIDFYAVWCPPCRKLSPALERLAGRHAGRLAVRKVDIVDWTMPVARQHGIEELPFLVLYDDRGKRVAQGIDVFPALGGLFGEDAKEVLEFAGLSATPASAAR